MKYFLMPIDYNNYYSPNTQGGTGPWSYSPHGKGRLDFAYNCQGPIYSMTDGVVTGVGYYSGDDYMITHCDIRYYDEILKENVVIRYLHGEYPDIHQGDEVKCGDQIGTISNHDKHGLQHLHIDFQDTTPYILDTMVGTLDFENRTFTYKNKTYPLKNCIDLNLIKTWNQQRGDSVTNTSIGYCWLVFAQEAIWKDPSDEPEGGIKIDRMIYDNHPGDPGHDNSIGVNAYFKAIFTEDFIGPPPNSWNDFLENWNLRCLVSFIRHETGRSIHGNYWLYASAVTAKMMRATVLCHKGVNEIWGAANGTHNFKEWILKGVSGATWLKDEYGNYMYDGFGTTTEHQWRAWLGSQYINAGKYLVTETPDEPSNILTENDLPWIQAVYNNFRYPDIYGNSLEPNIDSDFKQVIEDFANGLVTDNYYLNGTYGYPVSDMAFKAEYTNGHFLGYRHRYDPSGITGEYNTYAYTLSS